MQTLDCLRFAPPSVRRLIGVNPATWSRWISGKSRVPNAVAVLLDLLVAGDLSLLGETWAGWRLYEGHLVDPQGTEHSPQSIVAWHWTAQQVQAARARENLAALPDNVVPFPGNALSPLIRQRTNG